MTNPQGSQQSVRLWDNYGVIAASLQIGKFPPNQITGIVKDVMCSLDYHGARKW